MQNKPASLLFYASLSSALWFAVTAPAWTYLMNLFISLPVGLLSLLLWYLGRKKDPDDKRFRVIPKIWLIGAAVSVVVLIYFLIYE